MQFRWHKKYRARLNECDPHIIMSDRNDNEQKNPPFTTDFCIIQRYQWPTSGLSYRLQQSHDFSMNTTNEKHNSIFTSFVRIETVNTEQLTTATSISNNNNKKCPMNLTYFACPIRISSYCCMENTIHIYSKCTKGNKFNGFVLWFFDWVFFLSFSLYETCDMCAHGRIHTRHIHNHTCILRCVTHIIHVPRYPILFFFYLFQIIFSCLSSSPLHINIVWFNWLTCIRWWLTSHEYIDKMIMHNWYERLHWIEMALDFIYNWNDYLSYRATQTHSQSLSRHVYLHINRVGHHDGIAAA